MVCTHGRPRELEACLASMRRQALAPAEIVVADNAPGNGAARVVAMAAGARYVAVPHRGVSRARNAGARESRSRLIAFIDDDMTAHPRWLEGVRAGFADASVIAVTGPVLRAALAGAGADELEHSLRREPWGPVAFRIGRDCADWFERAHFGGLGDGNMAFRAEAFASWGGFEERIGRGAAISGGEEHYAFFELLERGHRIAYSPSAVVFHPEKPQTHDELLRAIAETAAYCCFVVANHPRYAPRVLRFLLQGLLGRRRAWRLDRPSCLGHRVSKARALAAFLRGAAAYRRSLSPWTPRPSPLDARPSQETTTQ